MSRYRDQATEAMFAVKRLLGIDLGVMERHKEDALTLGRMLTLAKRLNNRDICAYLNEQVFKGIVHLDEHYKRDMEFIRIGTEARPGRKKMPERARTRSPQRQPGRYQDRGRER